MTELCPTDLARIEDMENRLSELEKIIKATPITAAPEYVRCVDDSSAELTNDKVYKVIKIDKDGCYIIKDDGNDEFGYYTHRFKPATLSDFEQQSVVEGKPPIGIKPRFIWLEQRLEDINNAILRYQSALKEIPEEWVDERLKILDDLGWKEESNGVEGKTEWKEGDWAWNNSDKTELSMLVGLDYPYWVVDNQAGHTDLWYPEPLVKPTQDEIKKHLTAIAKKKYPVGTKFKSHSLEAILTVKTNDFQYLGDRLCVPVVELNSYEAVWSNGKWAEVLEDKGESLIDLYGKYNVGVFKHGSNDNWRVEVKLNGTNVQLSEEAAQEIADKIKSLLNK